MWADYWPVKYTCSNLVFCIYIWNCFIDFNINKSWSPKIDGPDQNLNSDTTVYRWGCLTKTLTQILWYIIYLICITYWTFIFTLMSVRGSWGMLKLCEHRSFYKVSSTSNNYSLLCSLFDNEKVCVFIYN